MVGDWVCHIIAQLDLLNLPPTPNTLVPRPTWQFVPDVPEQGQGVATFFRCQKEIKRCMFEKEEHVVFMSTPD